MLAVRARLVAGDEERAALVTGAADALARLLEDEVLAARLALDGQYGHLAREVVVSNERRVLVERLELGGALFPAGRLLLLCPLGRVADALAAPDVLAARTLLCGAERRVAAVADAMDAHPDRLLDAQRVALRREPLVRLDLEPEALAQLLCALLGKLGPGNLECTLGHLWRWRLCRLLASCNALRLSEYGTRDDMTEFFFFSLSDVPHKAWIGEMRDRSRQDFLFAYLDSPFSLSLGRRNESRFDGSAFFSIVLNLLTIFVAPFSFFSFGADGPACAGELMAPSFLA